LASALDLRVVGLDLGAGGLERGVGGVELRTRGRLGGQHLLLTREFQFRLAQRGLLHRTLGGDLVQRCLRVEHGVALGGGVDLGDQVALFDGIAQLHPQRLDLARGLRTDADQLVGIDHAGGFHGLFQVATGDRAGGQGGRAGLAQGPCDNAAHQDGQGDQQQHAAATGGRQAGLHDDRQLDRPACGVVSIVKSDCGGLNARHVTGRNHAPVRRVLLYRVHALKHAYANQRMRFSCRQGIIAAWRTPLRCNAC
jgi:hypothetical protein